MLVDLCGPVLAVGGAVAGDVFGAGPFCPVGIVVSQVPRFARQDGLMAAGAVDVAGLDQRQPCRAPRTVILVVSPLGRGGETPPVPAPARFAPAAAIRGQPAGGAGLAVGADAGLREGHGVSVRMSWVADRTQLMPKAKYDTPKPAHDSGLRVHRLEDEDFARAASFGVCVMRRPHLDQPPHIAVHFVLCGGSR